jgi:hypothetical protein
VCKRLVFGISILSQDKWKKCVIVRCQTAHRNTKPSSFWPL